MNSKVSHIFSIHSNICVVVVYDTIRKLLDEGNKVIVVSDRNTSFPFFSDKIIFHDIQYITDQYRKQTSNLFKRLKNYAFDYLPQYKKSALSIINEEDFILYLSSKNYFTMVPYLKNKHCKGYYYIEEGSMSYMDIDVLKRRYYKQLYHGQILLNFIGSSTSFDYEIDERFLGCIATSMDAFPWCKENKIITTMDGYFSNIPVSNVDIDTLIITDYLNDDKSIVVDAFKKIIDEALSTHKVSKIGIKFHPTAYSYQGEKIKEVLLEIRRRYSIEFVQLSASFSVEAYMFHRHIKIYSVFNVSSLLLYALLLGSRPFMLTHKDNDIKVEEILTVRELISILNKIN